VTDTVIRAVALCVVWRDDAVLVLEGFDREKGSPFYRPLGGGIEPGEHSREAAAREMQEEVGLEVTDLRLLGVLESIFRCNGHPGHEIVFVYEGRFVDASAYELDELRGEEANGDPIRATWRPLSFFNHHERLVPEGLGQLLASVDARNA
jgi:8-oxo-dGTP pyrophosphatase MutT (NUDIX family)